MKEAKQMFWMMLGVLIGIAVGALVLVKLFEWRPTIGDNPTLSLFISVPIIGAGLAGGGYLAQILVEKYERRKKRKQQVEKEKEPFRKKRKKKK